MDPKTAGIYRRSLRKYLTLIGSQVPPSSQTSEFEQAVQADLHQTPLATVVADLIRSRSGYYNLSNIASVNAEKHAQTANQYAEAADAILALAGIACEWPGLNPTYLLGGKQYHSLLNVARDACRARHEQTEQPG